jgi:D-alanine-D-alanine ligase-like ATP-grasp enzyme
LKITVVHESWRAHPLAWIHRAEARSVAAELRAVGHEVRLAPFHDNAVEDLSDEPILLRISDPVMLVATQMLTRSGKSYLGPGAAVMERCYDKYEAYRIALAAGIDCPATVLGSSSNDLSFPIVLKPQRGSDSIGVRVLQRGPIPRPARIDRYVVQELVRGAEMTVAAFGSLIGIPLCISLPEGTPYSFCRKYFWRPPRVPLADLGLVERVQRTARQIAARFGVDWAARIDLIHETATDRLRFLECDVAPLVGRRSAFAISFEAAGIKRGEQLRMLLSKTTVSAQRKT